MYSLKIKNYFKRWQVLYHPERFQGWGKDRRYFEGWYFKLISEGGSRKIAIIPGIAKDELGKGHSFIQILDGNAKTSIYYKFPLEVFRAQHDKFLINVGKNSFSEGEISLNLENIKGTIKMGNRTPWPVSWWSPGIMGPYAFVPNMECYHGIVSMDHDIGGSLLINGETFNFDNGRGYIEKDWGSSFPSAYFWMQSNHFSTKKVSLKCSVAKIPWMGSSFVGFIAGLWVKGSLFQFTTYNGSRLIESSADLKKVVVVIENLKYRLNILAERSGSTELASPIQGAMAGKVEESMEAILNVVLTRRSDGVEIFNDKGCHAGLEVAGKIEEIIIKYNNG